VWGFDKGTTLGFGWFSLCLGESVLFPRKKPKKLHLNWGRLCDQHCIEQHVSRSEHGKQEKEKRAFAASSSFLILLNFLYLV
jgi:hypothetical protein